MRNYWLKIFVGMLAIFAGGMIVIAIARQVRSEVHSVVNSSDPITIPLAFFPFRVDGERLGELDEIQVIRSTPKQVSGVEVTVDLADSIAAERFAGCTFTIEHFEHFDNRTTFRCVRDSADTAGQDLTPFGALHLMPDGHIHELLVPRTMANDLRNRTEPGVLADSLTTIAESLAAKAESIAELTEARIDSIQTATDMRIDSILRAAEAPDAPTPPEPPTRP